MWMIIDYPKSLRTFISLHSKYWANLKIGNLKNDVNDLEAIIS